MSEDLKSEAGAEVDEPSIDSSSGDEPTDLATCALCHSEVPRMSTYLVNTQRACEPCVGRLRDELAAQIPTLSGRLVSAACGAVGAMIGASLWAAIAIGANLEIGYIAVLVGFLAGVGVKYGAGKQRGPGLQGQAAVLAVFGLLAAKYMIFAHAVVKLASARGTDLGYFNGIILSHFPTALGEMVNAFDLVFLVIAVMAAYRVPKATAIALHGQGGTADLAAARLPRAEMSRRGPSRL